MISFPTVEAISVGGYGLYPGTEAATGLSLDLQPGANLILGVNGLGKSTLLLMLRHMITGPFAVREPGKLGEARKALIASNKSVFSARTADRAKSATATARLRIGDSVLEVERRLSDLRLISCRDLETCEEFDDEQTYQIYLCQKSNFADFADIVRVIDYLCFFLESRKTLVWNLRAQYEILRAILLDGKTNRKLKELEASIISSDSSERNIRSVLKTIRDKHVKTVSQFDNADVVRSEIAELKIEKEKTEAELESIDADYEKAESAHRSAQTQLETSDTELDASETAFEAAKYEVMRHAFAGLPASEAYVFLKLATSQHCSACGNDAKSSAVELNARIIEGRCPVCGEEHNRDPEIRDISEASHADLLDKYSQLEQARELRGSFESALEITGDRVRSISRTRSELQLKTRKIIDKIHELERELPPEEQSALREQKERIELLETSRRDFIAKREQAEAEFRETFDLFKQRTLEVRKTIEDRFAYWASIYFVEEVRLAYTPREEALGQGSGVSRFHFPAFEIEMVGTASTGDFIRREDSEVSLSQRDYLDLAFRMALLEAAQISTANLVVDSPEGAVDAVFAGRAGNLFSAFANNAYGRDSNFRPTLIAACNVVDGDFVPNLFHGLSKAARYSRLLDLTQIAAPTQALTSLREEYEGKIREAMSSATDGST
ncbi:AAA family ATPase [Maricaulis sp.]|uniref:AAA family ATPase n=1 Tax=Maricaulis sp. TaxID=1486257 RepID=UPI002607B820|nr:AAA family ATPase [Maricaulis sp.]